MRIPNNLADLIRNPELIREAFALLNAIKNVKVLTAYGDIPLTSAPSSENSVIDLRGLAGTGVVVGPPSAVSASLTTLTAAAAAASASAAAAAASAATAAAAAAAAQTTADSAATSSAAIQQSLNLNGWWSARAAADVTDTTDLVSALRDKSGASQPLTATAGARPLWIPWAGSNYMYCPFATGNGASTAYDAATFNTAGDLELIAKVRSFHYIRTNGGENQTLIGRWNTTDISFNFLIRGLNGTLRLNWWDGGATVTADSTVALPTADRADVWVRATLALSTGAVIFYTGSDGATWTQLGATVTLGVTTVASSGAQIAVGEDFNSTANGWFDGRIYYAQAIKGGVTLATFDAASALNNETSFSSGGRTWTLQQAGNIPGQMVACGSVAFDGLANIMAATFSRGQPCTVYLAVKQLSWTLDDTLVDGASANTGRIYQSATTPNLRQNAGTAGAELSTLALGVYGIITCVFLGSSSSIRFNKTTAVSTSVGTGSMGGFTLGAEPAATNFGNIQVIDALLYSVAHDTTAQNTVIDNLASLTGITV